LRPGARGHAQQRRSEGVTYLDLISLRRGRVVVHMWVASIDVPLDPLERSLAAAVAARAGSG